MIKSAYESAGVNIDAGQQAVNKIKKHVHATYTKNVLSNTGSFGGLFSLDAVEKIKNPVLVASTDGVGTKVKLAAQYNHFEGIGMDIVNHCIDDILVQGASPLFFLNYYATSKLIPDHLEQILKGMSLACIASNCTILGGETAEMPGVYCEHEFDVAGTIVGVVSREKILPRQDISPGDLLIGIASSGPHTNGFSLIRRIFDGQNIDQYYQETDGNLADALLTPHRNYHTLINPILASGSAIKAMAHITGGGFYDNIPRILPDKYGVEINSQSWAIPPLYQLIEKQGEISRHEMFRVFNMGVGLILVVSAKDAATVQSQIYEDTWIIGKVVDKSGVCING
ncbi:MAG: phosphoribosylformylglycinamidine cyclo-ligase [Anaerolineaceae bacterium]|nr:phosphoribosylformylglycinamidine cyclo-ligase [Anaerolineaceae bacterium]